MNHQRILHLIPAPENLVLRHWRTSPVEYDPTFEPWDQPVLALVAVKTWDCDLSDCPGPRRCAEGPHRADQSVVPAWIDDGSWIKVDDAPSNTILGLSSSTEIAELVAFHRGIARELAEAAAESARAEIVPVPDRPK